MNTIVAALVLMPVALLASICVVSILLWMRTLRRVNRMSRAMHEYERAGGTIRW